MGGARARAEDRVGVRSDWVSESGYQYRPPRNAENGKIADCLTRLTANNCNCGFGLCFLYLRNVKGLFMRLATTVVQAVVEDRIISEQHM